MPASRAATSIAKIGPAAGETTWNGEGLHLSSKGGRWVDPVASPRRVIYVTAVVTHAKASVDLGGRGRLKGRANPAR